MKLKGSGQLLPSRVQCNNIFKISFTFSLIEHLVLERVSEKVHATCLHWLWWGWNYKACQLPGGKTDQRASRADMEQRRGREHNRKGDLFSLGTSIWYSAAQTQSLPTSTHHKPTHLALLKEPYECPSSKNNIVTPFQTETYWIYNPFLSHMPCLLLIINTIYDVRADLYLHVRGRFCKKVRREKLKTYCCDASNMEAFSFSRE